MLNPKGCLAFGVISGTMWEADFEGSQRGPPCTWGPDLASEEDLDRHQRVNTLACIWLGRLFSPLLSSSHPPALASGATTRNLCFSLREMLGHLSPAIHPHLPLILFYLPHQQGPWRDLSMSGRLGCPCLKPASFFPPFLSSSFLVVSLPAPVCLVAYHLTLPDFPS